MGLLYTLTSLCAALVNLFLLDGGEQALEERTNEMIGSFGIALLTTMAGIVMRVPLQRRAMEGQTTVIRIPHSTREAGSGMVEVEGVTVDLERYAYELRKQLQTSSNAFASHVNQAILQAKTTHAHMDEMVKAFHDGLVEKTKVGLESMEAIYKAVAEKAEVTRQRTEAQQSEILGALEKLVAQVRSLDESIDRIRARSGETAENLRAIGVQATASTRAIAEGGKVVTEGLSALAEATEAERTLQAARAQFAKEMNETLERQAGEWTKVLQRAVGALKEMEETHQALAGLGQEARRTNEELTTLPDGLHKASEAIGRLTEVANVSREIMDLKAQVKLVTEQLEGIAGAGKRHQEAFDATVNKLQALAEVAGRELESQGKVKEAIAEIADVVSTAGSCAESLRGTEREIHRINTALEGVQSAIQNDGLELAEVLKQAIVAFDEAKRGEDTRSVLNRIFRP